MEPPFPPPDLETNNGVYSYEISQTTSSTEPLKRPGCELLSMRGSADGVFSVAVLLKIAWSPGRTKRRIGRRTMRAIGLVLLSIAIMALLLTDANAKRRSSAQGSQAAGAKESWCATYPSQGINDNCSYSSFNQCYQTAVLGRGGFCRPNPFPGTPYGTGYT